MRIAPFALLLAVATAACAPISERPATVPAAPAGASPLGTAGAPVQADMPLGQRAYLARLRCADGRAPQYNRRGNIGFGVHQHIIDLYDVDCGAAAPGRVEIQMDMYHPGHVETRAVTGFTIAPPPGPPTT